MSIDKNKYCVSEFKSIVDRIFITVWCSVGHIQTIKREIKLTRQAGLTCQLIVEAS